jgi:hypothetical protein
MAVPNMTGDFNLTAAGIDAAVKYVSPGVYALGYVAGNTFYVDRVGRSDDDVNRRLHDYEGQYLHFRFAYCNSVRAAFDAECELWHAYGGVNNPLHPARPAGKDWPCPRCSAFNKAY